MAMSKEHKEALAIGRKESQAVKRYLEALGSRKPGRPVTLESLKAKLSSLDAKIDSETNVLKRVELLQARLDAKEQLENLDLSADIAGLEDEFVKVAASYSKRRGISYGAWREAGVASPILQAAGIARTRRG